MCYLWVAWVGNGCEVALRAPESFSGAGDRAERAGSGDQNETDVTAE